MDRVFVGRAEMYERLREWLGKDQDTKVRVISVEGAGGIGKTTLIEEALSSLDLAAHGYLTVDLSGEDFVSDRAPQDPVTVLATIATRAREQLPKNREPYFSLTRHLKEADDAMKADTQRKLNQLYGLSETAKRTMLLLIQTGRTLGQVAPKVREYINLPEVDNETEQKIDAFFEEAHRTFRIGTSFFDQFKRFYKYGRTQDRLATDAWKTMSEDFYTDLAAILSEGPPEGRPKKVMGKDRLFLFVDDYESIQNDFGRHFLLRHFLRKLVQEAPFQTTVLISGRDELTATDAGWSKMFSQELRRHTIRLQPLREEDIVDLLRAQGFKGDILSFARKLYADTEGYPLLVELALDEQGRDGRPVVALMRFYERQTHWMTALQKKWLDHLCFLSWVNLETIPKVLPNEDEHHVFEWFQKEGSIRDTVSSRWAIRPFVRTRVLEYFRSRSPSVFEELQSAAGR